MSQRRRKPIPKVYSYIRFSTPEQSMGDSERRQLELAKKAAKKIGLPLDDTLDLTDRGLSGYHGVHRTKGKLGDFLAMVEAKHIAAGSYLLVENFTRLSREGTVKTLREVIFKLWDHGIILQTISPEEKYEPGCDKDPKFMVLFLFLRQAEESSRQKSEWGKANWKQKRKLAREQGVHITKRRPAWLDEDFKPIPHAVKCLKRIFKLKLQGVGVATIAEKMNQEKIWERPNGWRSSYVKKIITNRAVIGECQLHIKQGNKRIPDGDPIPDYYPKVVSNDQFFAVQKQLAGNRGCGGRKDRCSNLFTRIIKCAYCGGTMQFVDKGKPPKGQQYLQCSNGYRSHKCERYRIRYDECENLILNNCIKLNPGEVLPDPDEQTEKCLLLRHRIDAKEAEKRDIDRQIDNLVDQISRTESESIRDRYQDRVTKCESKLSEIEGELLEAEHELSIIEQDENMVSNWSKNLETLKDAIVGENVAELRLRLRIHLEELIDRIEVFAQGYREDENDENKRRPKWEKVKGKKRVKFIPAQPQQADDFFDVCEAQFSEFVPELWEDRMFRKFVWHLAEQRKTRKGRFIRIFFNTGRHVDLVPEGSLASGVELRENKWKRIGWSFESPKIDRMWRDFKTDYRKKKGKSTRQGKPVTT
ncbi:hypothetical protein FYZ48_07000 [Gimesia chilikensis]|uniref:recombinase family protein n=1 Tax=Gimesia chilikensis TaxID=2605989 RepID=UPI0011EDEBAB|nr:recombinase family protein [Gimesia chilikensis]KAA0141014.1 hypothetical protein FYZ48_07000 [Gimesia chilikensis]